MKGRLMQSSGKIIFPHCCGLRCLPVTTARSFWTERVPVAVTRSNASSQRFMRYHRLKNRNRKNGIPCLVSVLRDRNSGEQRSLGINRRCNFLTVHRHRPFRLSRNRTTIIHSSLFVVRLRFCSASSNCFLKNLLISDYNFFRFAFRIATSSFRAGSYP